VSLTLQSLGRLDALAGCTRYCLDAVPELRSRGIPILRDSWSSETAEIVALKPDLVIASVPYRQESLAAILKAGVPVLALAPHCLADIYSDIRLIGAVVNESARAEEVVHAMRLAIDEVRSLASRADRRPLVYCEEWGKPLIHSQQWVKELVEAAGGVFLGEAGKATDAESVAASDPEVIALAWCGAGDRVPVERVIALRGWRALRAVRAGRVGCIPDELLNTPAPSLVEGLYALARLIHPELFATADFGVS
jgi:iron complex transport system substrate-binding protein